LKQFEFLYFLKFNKYNLNIGILTVKMVFLEKQHFS
jgi:hypothetical protein